jgi:hypothetical protein
MVSEILLGRIIMEISSWLRIAVVEADQIIGDIIVARIDRGAVRRSGCKGWKAI